jgi:hypothetical protein
MADTLDLLSLAEGKAAIAAVDLNTSVASYITAVSRTIDDNCGPMVQRTLTSEAYDGGAGTIRLASTPVVSVTTVTEYQATTAVACTEETAGTAPANGYVLDPRSGYLYRRTSGSDGGPLGVATSLQRTWRAVTQPPLPLTRR